MTQAIAIRQPSLNCQVSFLAMLWLGVGHRGALWGAHSFLPVALLLPRPLLLLVLLLVLSSFWLFLVALPVHLISVDVIPEPLCFQSHFSRDHIKVDMCGPDLSSSMIDQS